MINLLLSLIAKFIIISVLLLISGCEPISNNNLEGNTEEVINTMFDTDIQKVKKGYLYKNKSLSLGQALDSYTYFDRVSWRSIKDNSGKEFVEFFGELNTNKILDEQEVNKKKFDEIIAHSSANPEKISQFLLDNHEYYSDNNSKRNSMIDVLSNSKSSQIYFKFIVNKDDTFLLIDSSVQFDSLIIKIHQLSFSDLIDVIYDNKSPVNCFINYFD